MEHKEALCCPQPLEQEAFVTLTLNSFSGWVTFPGRFPNVFFLSLRWIYLANTGCMSFFFFRKLLAMMDLPQVSEIVCPLILPPPSHSTFPI